MKKVYSLFFLFLFPFLTNAQEILTVEEVFDFEISDEFQYQGQGLDQPPNADRIIITGKYYSKDEDTVFYIRYHDSYNVVIENWEPVYHFYTKTDTVFYTNLNESIMNTSYWLPYNPDYYSYDTILEYSEDHCNILINGYSISTNDFEPIIMEKSFGKGLGCIRNFWAEWHEEFMMDNVLFYYKKGDIECGHPDNTTVSTIELNNLTNTQLYPNPTTGKIHLQNNEETVFARIELLDINGILIKNLSIKTNKWDLSNLATGIYFIRFSTKESVQTERIIIQ